MIKEIKWQIRLKNIVFFCVSFGNESGQNVTTFFLKCREISPPVGYSPHREIHQTAQKEVIFDRINSMLAMLFSPMD